MLSETLSPQSWLDFAELVDRIESKQKRLKSSHDQGQIMPNLHVFETFMQIRQDVGPEILKEVRGNPLRGSYFHIHALIISKLCQNFNWRLTALIQPFQWYLVHENR
jgi:hypothetical protein